MIFRIMVRIFSGILFLALVNSSQAQNGSIIQADSLFSAQQYTQAYDLYEEVHESGLASSSMLLKMAFIQDGLGNYEKALFFLETYYQKSADRNVVSKIEELSAANELRGYNYDDSHYFTALVLKYKMLILLLLLSLALLLLVYTTRKLKESERPFAAPIIQILVLLLAAAVNSFESPDRAIISSDFTVLRSGPSAGAEPIEQISKGHKVKVVDIDQVWAKIVWEGSEVYVKKHKLRLI